MIYVRVIEKEGDVGMELPCDNDGLLSTKTLQAYFPGASGLIYKHTNGIMRGVLLNKDKFSPPFASGWGSVHYIAKGYTAFKCAEEFMYKQCSDCGLVSQSSSKKETPPNEKIQAATKHEKEEPMKMKIPADPKSTSQLPNAKIHAAVKPEKENPLKMKVPADPKSPTSQLPNAKIQAATKPEKEKPMKMKVPADPKSPTSQLPNAKIQAAAKTEEKKPKKIKVSVDPKSPTSQSKEKPSDVFIVFGTLSCTLCSFKGTSKNFLRKHMMNIHNKKLNFKCSTCNFTSLDEVNVRRHFSRMHGNTKFVCQKCSYFSSSKCNIKKHFQVVHEGIRPYKCEVCGYDTASKYRLDVHRKQHFKKN